MVGKGANGEHGRFAVRDDGRVVVEMRAVKVAARLGYHESEAHRLGHKASASSGMGTLAPNMARCIASRLVRASAWRRSRISA